MRTEDEITQDIAAAAAAYQEAVLTLPAHEVRRFGDRVKALRLELATTLRGDAGPCLTCGELPHAMKRAPGVYEVGCLSGHARARGETAAAAATAWADGWAD